MINARIPPTTKTLMLSGLFSRKDFGATDAAVSLTAVSDGAGTTVVMVNTWSAEVDRNVDVTESGAATGAGTGVNETSEEVNVDERDDDDDDESNDSEDNDDENGGGWRLSVGAGVKAGGFAEVLDSS